MFCTGTRLVPISSFSLPTEDSNLRFPEPESGVLPLDERALNCSEPQVRIELTTYPLREGCSEPG